MTMTRTQISWNLRWTRKAVVRGLFAAALLAVCTVFLARLAAADPPVSATKTSTTTPPPSAPAPAPALLAVGAAAPDFTTVAHDGQKVELSKLKGKYVVLYFYPKDDTTGCTKEACDFRDNWATLQKKGVAVYGVSTQDNTSHQAFAQKYKLPFPLLPDDKGEIAARYKVPVVGGYARRITYLIGKDGKIEHVWPSVNPVGHASEILAQIQPTAAKVN